MIIYYSGSAGYVKGQPVGEPERVLGDDANIMLSYILVITKRQDQHKRLPSIVNARQRQKDSANARQP